MFQAFRIYDFIKDDENSDFYGVFVDRLYPRGIKKEVFSSFLWLKAVTPSSELRARFHKNRETGFEEFKLKFMAELTNKEALVGLNELKSLEKNYGKIALLTATKDINFSHVTVILEALEASNQI